MDYLENDFKALCVDHGFSFIQNHDDYEYLIWKATSRVKDSLHLHQYISYYLKDHKNLSFYKIDKEKVTFFMPLYYKFNPNDNQFFSLGDVVQLPAVDERLSLSVRSIILQRFSRILHHLIKHGRSKKVNINVPNIIEDKSFLPLIVDKFRYHHTRYDLYHKFDKKNTGRYATRKSYKNLINRGKKTFDIAIIKDCTWDEFTPLVDLHAVVSGRSTRSLETWRIIHSWLANKMGFAVIARDKSGVLTGFAIFRKTYAGYQYASAAYLRSLNGSGLSHAIMSTAMKHMDESGAENLYLGDHRPSLESEKEASIAHYKLGFCNTIVPYQTFTLK